MRAKITHDLLSVVPCDGRDSLIRRGGFEFEFRHSNRIIPPDKSKFFNIFRDKIISKNRHQKIHFQRVIRLFTGLLGP